MRSTISRSTENKFVSAISISTFLGEEETFNSITAIKIALCWNELNKSKSTFFYLVGFIKGYVLPNSTLNDNKKSPSTFLFKAQFSGEKRVDFKTYVFKTTQTNSLYLSDTLCKEA